MTKNQNIALARDTWRLTALSIVPLSRPHTVVTLTSPYLHIWQLSICSLPSLSLSSAHHAPSLNPHPTPPPQNFPGTCSYLWDSTSPSELVVSFMLCCFVWVWEREKRERKKRKTLQHWSTVCEAYSVWSSHVVDRGELKPRFLHMAKFYLLGEFLKHYSWAWYIPGSHIHSRPSTIMTEDPWSPAISPYWCSLCEDT